MMTISRSMLQLGDSQCSELLASRGQVIDLLLRGWPRNERVKRLCLDSTQRDVSAASHNSNRQIVLEREVALAVLLAGYSMDEDVACLLCRSDSDSTLSVYWF